MPRKTDHEISSDGTKVCQECHETFPRQDFTIDRSRPDGRARLCRPCGKVARNIARATQKQRWNAMERDPTRPAAGGVRRIRDALNAEAQRLMKTHMVGIGTSVGGCGDLDLGAEQLPWRR